MAGMTIRDRRVVASTAGAGILSPAIVLRVEGLAAFVAGVALFGSLRGEWLWLVPLLLLPDVSIAGYLSGPRVGATVYNVIHNWALGLAVIGVGVLVTAPALQLAGAILVAHVGMDRLVGYGLKYPDQFKITHLQRV
ncbi:MAG: DUF4260 domain-containing protein [Chloroflexota bacterium]